MMASRMTLASSTGLDKAKAWLREAASTDMAGPSDAECVTAITGLLSAGGAAAEAVALGVCSACQSKARLLPKALVDRAVGLVLRELISHGDMAGAMVDVAAGQEADWVLSRDDFELHVELLKHGAEAKLEGAADQVVRHLRTCDSDDAAKLSAVASKVILESCTGEADIECTEVMLLINI